MPNQILTPEQDLELEALVKLAHLIAYHRRWEHEAFAPKLSFLLQCLFAWWGIQKEQLPFLLARVNEIALAQKEELMPERRQA